MMIFLKLGNCIKAKHILDQQKSKVQNVDSIMWLYCIQLLINIIISVSDKTNPIIVQFKKNFELSKQLVTYFVPAYSQPSEKAQSAWWRSRLPLIWKVVPGLNILNRPWGLLSSSKDLEFRMYTLRTFLASSGSKHAIP